MNPSEPDLVAPRRVVLIDLDWQEADLVPDLLKRPELSVRLVAGESEENAGYRVAELCGLPRTTELADLTRQIFDLALVGERSGRRHRVERLLTALGTPIDSPLAFAAPPIANGHAHGNGSDGMIRVTAGTLDEALARAIPDIAEPEFGDDVPDPEDRSCWAEVLARWSERTGAVAAELLVGSSSHLDRIARFGDDDPLLESLIRLALAEDGSRVVSRLDGDDRGKAWAAWPFRTRHRRGVLAAARIDPTEGRATWEESMQSIRVAWERRERDSSATQVVEAAGPHAEWLSSEAFGERLGALIGRTAAAGARFALHRMRFEEAPDCVDAFCATLPSRVRETDALCRPGARDVLLLHHGSQASFTHVRRRLVHSWEEAWRATGRTVPAPPILEERVDLAGREDAEPFLATAARWLSSGAG